MLPFEPSITYRQMTHHKLFRGIKTTLKSVHWRVSVEKQNKQNKNTTTKIQIYDCKAPIVGLKPLSVIILTQNESYSLHKNGDNLEYMGIFCILWCIMYIYCKNHKTEVNCSDKNTFSSRFLQRQFIAVMIVHDEDKKE